MGSSLFDLSGRVAVVTGGAGGIGTSISAGLAEAGATVIITSRNVEAINEVAEQIRVQGRSADAIPSDVLDPASIKALASEVKAKYGRVDILVNCAGLAIRQPSVSFELDKWQRVMDINVKGTFICCQEFGKIMLEQKKGSIVNVSSVRGKFGHAGGYAAYGPSKGAVDSLTKTLAVEWAPEGVRVNAIAPTFIATALTEEVLKKPEFYQAVVSRIPMGRIGRPEDLVGAVIFFASDASNFITGQILYIDGGLTSA